MPRGQLLHPPHGFRSVRHLATTSTRAPPGAPNPINASTLFVSPPPRRTAPPPRRPTDPKPAPPTPPAARATRPGWSTPPPPAPNLPAAKQNQHRYLPGTRRHTTSRHRSRRHLRQPRTTRSTNSRRPTNGVFHGHLLGSHVGNHLRAPQVEQHDHAVTRIGLRDRLTDGQVIRPQPTRPVTPGRHDRHRGGPPRPSATPNANCGLCGTTTSPITAHAPRRPQQQRRRPRTRIEVPRAALTQVRRTPLPRHRAARVGPRGLAGVGPPPTTTSGQPPATSRHGLRHHRRRQRVHHRLIPQLRLTPRHHAVQRRPQRPPRPPHRPTTRPSTDRRRRTQERRPVRRPRRPTDRRDERRGHQNFQHPTRRRTMIVHLGLHRGNPRPCSRRGSPTPIARSSRFSSSRCSTTTATARIASPRDSAVQSISAPHHRSAGVCTGASPAPPSRRPAEHGQAHALHLQTRDVRADHRRFDRNPPPPAVFRRRRQVEPINGVHPVREQLLGSGPTTPAPTRQPAHRHPPPPRFAVDTDAQFHLAPRA